MMGLKASLIRGTMIVGMAILHGLTLFPAEVGAQTAGDSSRREHEFRAMGVLFRVVAFCDDAELAQKAFAKVEQRVEQLETAFSDYRDDSESMRLVRQPLNTPIAVGEDLYRLLEMSRRISEASSGAFDATAGPVTRLWRLARKRHRLPEANEILAVQSAVGWRWYELAPPNRVRLLQPGMRFDFGAIAKGFAADESLIVLQKMGIASAMVAASGDVALGDPPPGQSGWRVAMADYRQHGETDGELLLANCGVATSSDAQQFLEQDGVRYSHVVDPRSGQALTSSCSATVVATSAAEADAWATALCVQFSTEGLQVVERQGAIHARVVVQTQDDEAVRRYQTHSFANLIAPPESAASKESIRQ